MKIRTFPCALVTAGAAALVAASSVLAAGEPKNVPPFTRAVLVERAPALALAVRRAATGRSISGEAKNQAPFIRPSSSRIAGGRLVVTGSETVALAIQGEPKSDLPFTDPAGEKRRLTLALQAATRLVARAAAGEPANASAPATVRLASGHAESFSWVVGGLLGATTAGICLASLGTFSARRGRGLRDIAGRS